MAILVGGTNYYIESILWNILIDSNESTNSEGFLFEREMKRVKEDLTHPDEPELLTADNIFDHPIHIKSFPKMPSSHLHSILNQLDHQSAKLYHPSDKRKIIRALQVFQQTGRKYSEHLADQKSKGSSFGGPLRYPNALCFWVRSEPSILKERMDKRVDQMIEKGLIKELHDFHIAYNKNRTSDSNETPYTQGIFQSIGFKEFHSYLTFPPDGRERLKEILLTKSIEELKIATRQYARIQEKWIINRFIRVGDRDVPDVFVVDTSNPHKWQDEVVKPTFEVIRHRFYGSTTLPTLKPEVRTDRSCVVKELFYCKLCDKHVHGNLSWSSHLKSKKHLALTKQQLTKEKADEKAKNDVDLVKIENRSVTS